MVLSVGITFYLFFQTITHIGWASHVIPSEGMGLPFMDHGPSIILFMIALGMLISCAREKRQGLFREGHTLAFVKKRVSVTFVVITIASSLLLVRLFQYQVLNRDWHMSNLKGISESFGLSGLILKD